MSTPTQARGLEFIRPLEITVVLDGDVPVTIKPLVLAELPLFLAACVPVFAAMPRLGDGFIDRLLHGRLADTEFEELMSAVAVNGDGMINLLAIATRQPAEMLSTLLLDRAAELAMACFEVNRDFFRRAMPAIRAKALLHAQSPAAEPSAPPEPPTSSTTATPSSS